MMYRISYSASLQHGHTGLLSWGSGVATHLVPVVSPWFHSKGWCHNCVGRHGLSHSSAKAYRNATKHRRYFRQWVHFNFESRIATDELQFPSSSIDRPHSGQHNLDAVRFILPVQQEFPIHENLVLVHRQGPRS